MSASATPTIIRHLDTGTEVGVVISVSFGATYGAEFQVYERITYDEKDYDDSVKLGNMIHFAKYTAGSLKFTTGQYEAEQEAIEQFDRWADGEGFHIKNSRRLFYSESIIEETQTHG